MESGQAAESSPSQSALLTTVTLRLASEVRTSQLSGDRIVVKYQPGRRYLVLSPNQWRVLQDFGAGQVVPDVLLQAITGGRCPPLREFYELVLKACHHGFLQGPGLALPAGEQPAAWALRLPGALVRWAALAAIVLGVVVAAGQPLVLPESGWAWVTAWLTLCVGVSLGNVVAACVVRGGGGEIYRPQLIWASPVPHFGAVLSDELLAGRAVAIDAALAGIGAPVALLGVIAAHAPQALLPLLCGMLLHLSPLWRSPLSDLLRALYRDPQLATTYGLMFVPNRLFTLLANARLKFADRKFLLASALATVLWLAGIFVFSAWLLRANAADWLRQFQAAGGWHVSGMALLGLLAALLLGTLALVAWIVGRHASLWFKERADKTLRSRTVPLEFDSVRALLRDQPIFRELPEADLDLLTATVQPEEFPAGAFVTREGDLGDKLFVVFSGRLLVSQKLQEVGRVDPFGELGPGDLFGERALLGDGHRTATIRCATESVLLSLSKAEFSALVLSRVSREAIEDKVQKTGFLRRIALSRHWSQATMARFARRAQFHDVPKAAMIAREGAGFPYFCLIHEGEFLIEKQGKEVGRLRRGDYYGELSMLWHNTAKANIVALTTGRCLLIPVGDFLAFITRDVAVVLQFERIGADKLGRPVFGDAASSSFQPQVVWSER